MAGIMYEKNETAISLAIKNNDLAGLKVALEDGEDPHYKDRKGNTYLHYLCTMNRPYLIHLLIGTQIDLNAVNRHGNTALHVTALQSECCHVGDLMAAGINAGISNKDGKTAFEIPTNNSFWKTIYKKYEPGIFEAVDSHDVDKVLYLLSCWSRVDTLRDGLTLRQFAACRKFHDLVFNIDLHRHTLNAIYAVLEDNPEKAWPFLSHNKCNVNLLNVASGSKHILQEAIRLADIRLVRMICRSKVNANVRVTLSNFLKAPLFFAVLNPKVNSDIRWEVLRSDCDFTLRDERGRNAAVYALDRFKGEVPYDVITFMMKNKLDVSHRDATGVTLRDVTRFYRRKDILRLIDKAYVKILRTSNISELERLCCMGYDSLLINFNYRDTFIYASGNESEDVLNFVQWIPVFFAQVRRLFYCIRYKSLDDVIETIRICHKPHLLINARDKGGRTPMHVAILHWRFDVLKLLIRTQGIDRDAQDNCGRTALHYACCVEEEDERTELCSILYQAGVDPENLDFNGHNASHYMGNVKGQIWLTKERKTSYGTPKQLACVDKYEELYRMMKGKGKTLDHFNDSVKRFKHPIAQLHNILDLGDSWDGPFSPIADGLKTGGAAFDFDITFQALNKGVKPKTLKALHYPSEYVETTQLSPIMPKYQDLLHAAVDNGKEDIAVRLVQLGNSLTIKVEVTINTDADTRKSKQMTVLERAKHLGMDKLAIAIEKRIKYQQDKLDGEMIDTKVTEKGLTQERSNDLSVHVYKVRKLSTDENGDVSFEEEVADDDSDDNDYKGTADKDDVSISDAYSDNFDDVYSDDNDRDGDSFVDTWE